MVQQQQQPESRIRIKTRLTTDTEEWSEKSSLVYALVVLL